MQAKLDFLWNGGAALTLGADEILSATIEEGVDAALLGGEVLRSTLTAVIAPKPGKVEGAGELIGAQAVLWAGSPGAWTRVGAFTIASVQDATLFGAWKITACDVPDEALSEEFLPIILGDTLSLSALWAAWREQAGLMAAGAPPTELTLNAMPDWDGADLKRVGAWIAQAAGCALRIDRMRRVSLAPLNAEPKRSLGPGDCFACASGYAAFGPVEGVAAVDGDGVERLFGSDAGRIVRIEGNPIVDAMADGSGAALLTAYRGMTLAALRAEHRIDWNARAGDVAVFTLRDGTQVRGAICKQTISIGDDRAVTVLRAPETSAVRVRALTKDGRVNAEALTGFLRGERIQAGTLPARAFAPGAVSEALIAALTQAQPGDPLIAALRAAVG